MDKLIISKIIELFKEINSSDSLESQRDRQYNRIARDQPAYISLLFPVTYVILTYVPWLYNDSDGSLGRYIFNSIAASLLFIPALFFLYKQIIRAFSEVLIEFIVFKLISPTYVLSANFGISLTAKDRIKLKNLLHSHVSSEEDLTSGNLRKRSEALKTAIRYVRDLKLIRDNSIVFENNCIYGFFRNLSGGCLLNIIVYYSCRFAGILDNEEYMIKFYSVGLSFLWVMIVLFTIMAWCARYRHLKRELILFIDHYPHGLNRESAEESE